MHAPRQRCVLGRTGRAFQETRMPDDPSKTGADRQFISLEQPHEIRSWTESLGVTEEQLKAAVAAVGHSADKVREYLRKAS